MKPKIDHELPGTESRITSVLRSKGLRSELAELAGSGELSPTRELVASDLLADHLGKNRSVAADAEFFDTRSVSEAIILRLGRPVLFINDGVIEKAKAKEIEDVVSKARKALVKPVGAVGRIELSDHDTYDWCGTGWRVDEDFIITNRHVANIFAQRQGAVFQYRVNAAGKQVRAHVDFREEYKGKLSEEFGIAEIVWIADDNDATPDMAVLKIRRDPGLPEPLSLAAKDAAVGQWIGVVGYPAKDSRNDAITMSEIFKDIYDVKRFSPGKVVNPGKDTWYLTHDASTLGGNSGSAALDLATRKVVGLHFGGSFKKTNYAVTVSTIKRILARKSWVALTGKDFKSDFAPEFKETKRTVASMKGRAGYRDNFLGLKVALPNPGGSHSVLNTNTPNKALPYTHFSIVMSKSRRFPIFTAENLNGALKIKLKRRDSWGYDPRIPKGAQVGHDEFYLPEPFDKGHMVRRENPGWGQTEAEARLGEDDTFVYTNAIPQMPQLNQKTWLSLENYVLENARTEGFKVSVFTGPVFRDDDPAYSDVQVPIDFWKVVVAIDADTKELLSSAYVLSQEGLMPKEGFRFGPFKTYQVPVKRVEELADLRFPKAVRDADVFGEDEINEMISTGRYVEINSGEDVVLSSARK
jgi:endonuclease G